MSESRTLQIFRCVRLACGFRFVTSIFRFDSKWSSEKWKSEEISSDLQLGTFLFFLLKNIQGHRQVSGLSPCMCSRQKRFVVDVKRSIVYYCSQTHLPDFPSMNCFAYSSSEHQFWSLNSILIFSAVKQTTWEDDLLRIVTDSQCQENSNQVNLRESKGSLELV